MTIGISGVPVGLGSGVLLGSGVTVADGITRGVVFVRVAVGDSCVAVLAAKTDIQPGLLDNNAIKRLTMSTPARASLNLDDPAVIRFWS
jgi:hypothetical protein